MQPWLRVVKVHDMFSQLMEDEVDVFEMQWGIDVLLRIYVYPSQGLQHLPYLLFGLRHLIIFMFSTRPSAQLAKQAKTTQRHAKKQVITNPAIPKKSALMGPLASLKKFCESLPCSQMKPSGLNLIVWRKKNYSPNEKERRLKVENDAVKQHISHESSKLRKNHLRARSVTEPTATQSNYKQQFAKIARKQVSTSLLSRQEEEIFGHMCGQGSVRQEFKRNHKQVWSFIIRKKKSVEVSQSTPNKIDASNKPKTPSKPNTPDKPQTPYTPNTTNRPSRPDNSAAIQIKRQQKQRFNQRLHDYLRKWKPSERQGLSGSKTDFRSTNRNNSTGCSKFTTIAMKSEVLRGDEDGSQLNNQKSTQLVSCF